MTRNRRLAAILAAIALLISSCTGIPDSSAPATVAPVRVGEGSGPASTQPQPGVLPRVIVTDFLDYNAVESGKHTEAREYLTPTARNQWSDQRVTVIADRQIKTYNDAKKTLVVTGRVVGTINSDGIYTPTLQGTGNGGKPIPFPFTLRKVAGQYRIDQLRGGLLITADQFAQTYTQQLIYYYDLAGHYLVPDVRWTSIPSTDSAELTTWLIDRLVESPRPDLQDVVRTDTFPAQADANHIRVTIDGASTTVEIPGTLNLTPSVQNRLAVQLTETLAEALPGGTLTITDGGTRVTIPAARSTTFSAASLTLPVGPTPLNPKVYYVQNGKIVNQSGKPISGPLGDGHYYLNSIALARRDGDAGPLLVAATEGSGTAQRLVIGTQSSGVAQTTVHGALTRPAWAPAQSEVWIGVGSTIHRLTVDGKTVKDSVVQVPPTAGGGRVVSLHFSPDGSRIALVVAGATGTSGQLYVGSVARDAGTVRLTALEPVSPAGVVVTDADWSNSHKLTVIGYFASSTDAGAFETYVDGSSWASTGTTGLPNPPLSITASTYGVTWVQAGNQVWKQKGQNWESASTSGVASGSNPTYLS